MRSCTERRVKLQKGRGFKIKELSRWIPEHLAVTGTRIADGWRVAEVYDELPIGFVNVPVTLVSISELLPMEEPDSPLPEELDDDPDHEFTIMSWP